MNKLIIKGSVLQNFEVIKNFKEQNELTFNQLYAHTNLSQNQIEAFFHVYRALDRENLEKFALLNHE